MGRPRSPNMGELGRLLYVEMERLGIKTREELATKAKIGKNTVSQIMMGNTTNPRWQTMVALADLCDRPLDFFRNGLPIADSSVWQLWPNLTDAQRQVLRGMVAFFHDMNEGKNIITRYRLGRGLTLLPQRASISDEPQLKGGIWSQNY